MTMKKYLIFLLFLTGACIQEPDTHSYELQIVVDFGESVPIDDFSGAIVKLSNQTKNYAVQQTTNEQGVVRFLDIEPGFYSVTVTHSISSAGIVYYYNGLKTIDVLSSLTDTIPVSESKTNAFVIKEYYYVGCLTEAGKAYSSDQYVEIYNNTDAIQYADGFSIIEHESYATEENYWKDISDTIVARMIWTIPGTGYDVPVKAGESIILARDGIDHKDDPNGNPLCPVNLGTADFEFYVEWTTDKDIDSPTVENLDEDLFVFRGSDISFHTRGGSAIAIAKIPGSNQDERLEYINNHLISKASSSGSDGRYYGMVANEYIIDAVEVTWDESHAIYKRFPVELDAGYTYVEAGSKSGKCVRRKISKITEDGRVIYQDTNNSTEDFLKGVDPKPKVYEE